MKILDTEMRYFASDVMPTPNGANGCPSREYCRGPPGVCIQWYIGTRALMLKPSGPSHWRISCRIWNDDEWIHIKLIMEYNFIIIQYSKADIKCVSEDLRERLWYCTKIATFYIQYFIFLKKKRKKKERKRMFICLTGMCHDNRKYGKWQPQPLQTTTII